MRTFALLSCLAGLVFANPAGVSDVIRKLWYADEKLPDLAPKLHGTFEPEPGIIAERVSYGTQFGMRVPAILYRPKQPRAKAPALIVVNGHGGDKYSWYSMYSGVLYARAGAFVLTYDPTGEGERNGERKSGTREHDRMEPIPELGQRIAGLMMTDIRQAVAYLRSRPEVDPARVGAMGYSMGSFILSVTCAAEPALSACVLVGGGNLDGPGGYWDSSKPMCQGYPYKALQGLGDRASIIYSAHAGATLVYNGDEDTTVAIPKFGQGYFRDLQSRVRRQGAFDVMFHPGTGHRPYFVTRPVALWLEKHLDLPNWTAQDIEAMPVTRIGEWASRNNVPMDPVYAIEHREGGTPALGVNVPGIRRDSLHVFAEQEWQTRRDGLVHESWRRKAKVQMRYIQ